MLSTTETIDLLAGSTTVGRKEAWAGIADAIQAQNVLEIGVWDGEFSSYMLSKCSQISRYYMLDPWKHLENWNKPFNVDQGSFDRIYAVALEKTDFARHRRILLRGTTTEMIEEVPDASLDLAYIDGDHTLRGITIDLVRTYAKVRPGGIVGGDDYKSSIWQHASNYEPTLVYPFAAYFAEAKGAPFVVLPNDQFAIIKPSEPGIHFQFIDVEQRNDDRTLLSQFRRMSSS